MAMLAGGLVVQWALLAKPVLPILGQIAAWKAVFIVVGLPGLLVALLMAFTVWEPARVTPRAENSEMPSMGDVAAYVGRTGRCSCPYSWAS